MYTDKELSQKYRAIKIFDKIEAIGKKHSLHLDQVGVLDAETRALIVGVTPRENFSKELVENLDISFGKAEAIVQDINNEIMLPLRETLKQPDLAPGTKPSPFEEIPHPAVAIRELENPTSTTSANILNRSFEQQLLSKPSSTPSTHELTVVKSTPATTTNSTPKPAPASKISVPLPPSKSGKPMAPRPPAPPKPPVKSYTADPYREPIK